MKNAFKSNINVDAKINQEVFQNIIFCFKGLLFWICFPLSRDGCLPSATSGKSVDRRVTDKDHSKQLGLPAHGEIVAYPRGTPAPRMDFYLRDQKETRHSFPLWGLPKLPERSGSGSLKPEAGSSLV